MQETNQINSNLAHSEEECLIFEVELTPLSNYPYLKYAECLSLLIQPL